MQREIIEKIESFQTVIIHRHERPDPDALGSQVGLAAILKSTYPKKQIYVVGEEEPSLNFLAKMDEVTDAQFDGALIIVCDTANEERISDKRYQNGKCLIKIDHHPDKEQYGDLSWVDTSFSSTSEMIYELFATAKEKGWVMKEDAALLLYSGIVGDTGRFLYPSTTDKTHLYTSELLKYDFNRQQLYASLYQRSIQMTRLQGYVLQHFEFLEGGLGVVKLTKEMLKQYGISTNESSVLVNAFSDVEGLKAWVFFVEDEDGSIRVRIRSKGPHINEIASKYQGGGHPLASGAKARSWEETDEIIADLQQTCFK